MNITLVALASPARPTATGGEADIAIIDDPQHRLGRGRSDQTGYGKVERVLIGIVTAERDSARECAFARRSHLQSKGCRGTRRQGGGTQRRGNGEPAGDLNRAADGQGLRTDVPDRKGTRHRCSGRCGTKGDGTGPIGDVGRTLQNLDFRCIRQITYAFDSNRVSIQSSVRIIRQANNQTGARHIKCGTQPLP